MNTMVVGFTNKLKNWNKCIYSHINNHKRQLFHNLSKIQHSMDVSGSNSLVQSELEVRNELECTIHHEMLWRQKSQCE